ncbi:MAG: phenylacetate-CoA oxygenase subunit PaaI [Zavarzinia sp.]|nr:phenylacetate-CoA oxygenase subunit PaaI [Zavarzinia sp.]
MRLGDGTDYSHGRMQQAIDALWPYTGELFEAADEDAALIEAGIAVDGGSLRPIWRQRVIETLARAALTAPDDRFMHSGGRKGIHSEHMGRLLAEMQHIPRSHPGARW